MSDDMITITAGAQSDVEPGVYEVTLVEISEPRTIYPQTGPNAGKEVTLRDWTFALDDGSATVTGSASTASGPKSKTYAWITALLGHAPEIGKTYPRSQLVGRGALATITVDEAGWARIANLSGLPKARAAKPEPEAPARRAQVAQPVAAATGDDVPF